MKTTNKSSALDDHKLKYELTDKDPKKTVPKAVQMSRLHRTATSPKTKRVRRPGIIRTYFGCMLEVILA
jgi:hypothetical protein